MKYIRACFIAVLVLASIAVPITARADTTSPSPAVDTEHARLVAMSGDWDVAMTFWFRPGGAGVRARGTSVVRPLFGGLFIQEDVEGTLNGKPFSTRAWTGFNPATRQYEATRIASTNTIRISESGAYDEKEKRFELRADYVFAGDTWHQRTVIEPSSADAMSATSYLSFGSVPEWKAVEITYTRRAK